MNLLGTLLLLRSITQVLISQIYPRPGNTDAKISRFQVLLVKERSCELTAVFESFTPYNEIACLVERIWITDVGCCCFKITRTIFSWLDTPKDTQVLNNATENLIGSSSIVRTTSVGRCSFRMKQLRFLVKFPKMQLHLYRVTSY